MGRELTGITVGTDGVTIISAAATGEGLKLIGSWRDGRALDLCSPVLIRERVGGLLLSAGVKRGAAAVSLPDMMARVATNDFQELPAGKKDAELLLRAGASKSLGISETGWRLATQLFDIPSGKRALSAAVKDETWAPVEEGLSSAGLKVRRAGIHSFNLANLLPQGDEDGALIARCQGFVTVIFFRAGVPDFYRCKPVEGTGSEAWREVAASFAFYKGKNPQNPQGKVYMADETGCLPESLPDSIKAALIPVGPEFTGLREMMPGVLPALGACLTDA